MLSSYRSGKGAFFDRPDDKVVELDPEIFKKKQIIYTDGLTQEHLAVMRVQVEKRREAELAIQAKKDAEKEKIAKQTSSRAYSNDLVQFKLNSTKPLNVTFTSEGKIIKKRKVNVENLPQKYTETPEIARISKIKVLENQVHMTLNKAQEPVVSTSHRGSVSGRPS